MPKTVRPKKAVKKSVSLYAIYPWECRHHKGHSEIVAYVEASGEWEVVADMRATAGASAETMATFICNTMNASPKNSDLLRAAMEALELCLEEDSLTFTSEQAADRVVSNIKLVVK